MARLDEPRSGQATKPRPRSLMTDPPPACSTAWTARKCWLSLAFRLGRWDPDTSLWFHGHNIVISIICNRLRGCADQADEFGAHAVASDIFWAVLPLSQQRLQLAFVAGTLGRVDAPSTSCVAPARPGPSPGPGAPPSQAGDTALSDPPLAGRVGAPVRCFLRRRPTPALCLRLVPWPGPPASCGRILRIEQREHIGNAHVQFVQPG